MLDRLEQAWAETIHGTLAFYKHPGRHFALAILPTTI
jgi:hypothetical protein